MAHTLQQLADYLGASHRGDDKLQISSVASLEDAQQGDICFVGSDKYLKALEHSAASAVIIREDLLQATSLPAIIVDNPRAAYARLVSYLYPELKPAAGIHPSAVIDPSARVADTATIAAQVVIEAGAEIAEDVRIDAGCFVGRDSRIGRGTHLYPNVTIYHQSTLGEYCIMHASSVVGSDGFGFEYDQGEWIKIPQIGGVVIGNRVEIGACSVVDRGALQDTVIEDGVKLDNHVQIAHNVHVGEHTVMSRGVGIAGSTRIGKHCLFAGMTGVKDHIEITDNVTVTAMSMVSKSLTKAGSYSSNTPIDETRNWRKNSARFRQLDEMARRIRQLEKQLQEKS
jgi:UDP-3-O-[3-hydroxymyristoyl] glucosamine N-acyltransferase